MNKSPARPLFSYPCCSRGRDSSPVSQVQRLIPTYSNDMWLRERLVICLDSPGSAPHNGTQRPCSGSAKSSRRHDSDTAHHRRHKQSSCCIQGLPTTTAKATEETFLPQGLHGHRPDVVRFPSALCPDSLRLSSPRCVSRRHEELF